MARPLMLVVYIVGNAMIVGAYLALAYLVGSWHAMPKFALLPSFAFFVLCGFTHADLMLHALTNEPITRSDMASWTHALLHLAQGGSAIFGAIGVAYARRHFTEALEFLDWVRRRRRP